MKLRRYAALLFVCALCYKSNGAQTGSKGIQLQRTNTGLKWSFSPAVKNAKRLADHHDLIKKETLIRYLKLLKSSLQKNEVTSGEIGSVCLGDKDCPSGPGQACQKGSCRCRSKHVQLNATLCLPGVVLGFGCVQHSQCRLRVPGSSCVQGFCQCGAGTVPYRRANCLTKSAVGEWCRIDSQCQLGAEGSECRWIVRNVMGRCACKAGLPAARGGGCPKPGFALGAPCGKSYDCAQHVPGSVCVDAKSDTELNAKKLSFPKKSKLKKSSKRIEKPVASASAGAVCQCPEGYLAIKNGTRCVPVRKEIGVSPVSLGNPCHSTGQCKASDPYTLCSHGICDCEAKTDQCSAKNTGCPKDTFQCASDGRCLSAYFVCDGKRDCNDGSDEAQCRQGRCSPLAFACRDGTCVARGRLCDGARDCPDHSDESECASAQGAGCPRTAFRCASGECLPGHAFCNAVPSCRDASDERPDTCIGGLLLRGPTCPFRCKNGRCRSTAVICSGIDGCGDNSDEENCSVCNCSKPWNTAAKNY